MAPANPLCRNEQPHQRDESQERELAHAMEVDESLQRLKAEYAALQQRIAVADMQAAETRRPVA
jgi:hypothetical protein